MTDRDKLSFETIRQLKAQGLNQTQIAEHFGVSRQSVSWHWTTYNGPKTPRQVVMEAWPFEVPRGMGTAWPSRHLRNHGEYIVTGGKGMTEEKLKRLRGFYKRMRDNNLVIEFDPGIPPEDGVSVHGGWAYRQRVPSDGDLLIRVNEHTHLTEDGKKIWRFPKKEP